MKTVQETRWNIAAFTVARDQEDALEQVARVRELRARILFDRGRRPDFRSADGRHTDDQDLDFGSWHFVASGEPDGPPLGYVRLSPPDLGESFQSRAFLGPERYRQQLLDLGLDAKHVFEHSRLVVEHRARKLGLGIHLNAMAIAAAHCLGATAMIGTSGTKDGQDKFHQRFGFRPLDGTRRHVPQYTEDVVLMLHLTRQGAGEHTPLVQELEQEFRELAAPGSGPADGGVPVPRHRTAPPAPNAHRDRAPAPAEAWQPKLYRLSHGAERDEWEALLGSGQVREVCDTIEAQLVELARSREPFRTAQDPAIAAAVRDQLAGQELRAYGTWAWYPWSGRMVHLLPREEFRLVRTDRNRGKISRPEQRRLLARRIGVIGLSVGSSAALTLAQEGIGGAFRLADFDELSLSNLNRLRAGVHDLGTNKTVLAARQMFEIDPYLDIEIHPDGLTDRSMKEFFAGSGDQPLDLLVEECDTPYVKFAAREQARALGIPVVMDANDRGLLDIERFDTEPNRPLLHGLLGDTTAGDLAALDQAQTVALILKMVDADRISPDLAASIPEIGRTLSSWPQLASGVALGGALVAEAARRILLHRPCPSGRYYTDLEASIAPGCSTVN